MLNYSLQIDVGMREAAANDINEAYSNICYLKRVFLRIFLASVAVGTSN